MSKIIFTAGKEDKPLFKVTIETIQYNHGDMPDLQKLIADYFVMHGGLKWSVSNE